MYFYLTCSIFYGVNLYLDLENVNKFNSVHLNTNHNWALQDYEHRYLLFNDTDTTFSQCCTPNITWNCWRGALLWMRTVNKKCCIFRYYSWNWNFNITAQKLFSKTHESAWSLTECHYASFSLPWEAFHSFILVIFISSWNMMIRHEIFRNWPL
jgi:hypothetical protein